MTGASSSSSSGVGGGVSGNIKLPQGFEVLLGTNNAGSGLEEVIEVHVVSKVCSAYLT
jgi:hypothetical protein